MYDTNEFEDTKGRLYLSLFENIINHDLQAGLMSIYAWYLRAHGLKLQVTCPVGKGREPLLNH
jgi:hypothetical protein